MVVLHQINGKRKCFGLDSAFAVRLQQAQNLANEYRSKIALGIDPKPKKIDVGASSHLVKDVYFEAMGNRRVTQNSKGNSCGKRVVFPDLLNRAK